MSLSNQNGGTGKIPPDTGDPTTGDEQRFRAVETWDSRELSVQSGKRTRRRRFIVYATEGAEGPVPSDVFAVQQTGVLYGQPHPKDPFLLALDLQVRVLPNTGRTALEVVWLYRRGELDNVEPDDPTNPSYQEINIDGEAQFLDVYRSGAVIPANGEPAGRNDIGGSPIDVGGEPISVLIRVARYSIVRNYAASQFNAAALLSAVGRRNSAVWPPDGSGFAPGAVLYARPSSTRIGQGVIRVTHQLVVDQDTLHLRQQALADEEGGVRLSTEVPGGVGDGHAETVYHVQPFPELLDFNSLDILRGDG